MRLSRAWLAAALAVFAVGAIYLALLAWLPRDSLWSGDQGAKLVQVISLIRAKLTSLAIPDQSLAYDPSGRFSPLPALYTWQRDGTAYSIFPYPYAGLTAPFFFALGYAGLYVVPLLATLGALTLSAALGARLGLRPLWAIPPILGLATPLGFYAVVFWEHALATMLATAALLLAARGLPEKPGDEPAGRGTTARWLLCGLLAGLAWWFRAEALLLGPSLLAGLAWAGAGRRALAWAAAGATLALAPLALFNLLVYGAPLGAQVAANYGAPGAAAALVTARLVIVGELLVGLSHRSLFWFAAWASAAAAALAPPRMRPWAVAALALCAAGGLLATQARDLDWSGLANAATLTLLAPLGLRLASRAPAARLLGGASFAYVAAALVTAPNGGGAQWGPRYLLLALPALCLLALLAARELVATGAPARWLAALALGGLLVAAVGVQLRGFQLLEDSYARNQRIVRVVNARPAPLIVTDAIYGPQLLGPLYFERPILFVDGAEPWPELAALLRERGESSFALLTDKPRQQAVEALRPLGVTCELVEGLSFGLSLFDCTLALQP